MNTPDTETEKEIEKIVESLAGFCPLEYADGDVRVITTKRELRTALHSLLTSRDTYWKEREMEAVKAEKWRIMQMLPRDSKLYKYLKYEQFLTPITNEDN